MARPQERYLLGKTVARVEWNEFYTGRGREKTTDPVLVLSDGSRVSFTVRETDVGRYGIEINYYPKRRVKMKTKRVYTARKYNGDDCYSWAVFRAADVKGTRGIVGYGRARPVMTGLSQSSARCEVNRLNEEAARKAAPAGAPELTAEEQTLAAKWLTTSNLGMPEPKAPTAEAIERAFQRCAEAFGADGIDIGEEYRNWLKDARAQDAFVREQWAEFKRTGVAS